MGGRGLCEWMDEVVSGFGRCVVEIAAKLVTISVTNDLLITFEIYT